MVHTASYGMGSGSTPNTIKRIVTVTSSISIFCAFINNILLYFGMSTPQQLLSLSWNGLSNWYIWEPFTYLFVQAGGEGGISIGFLFALFINMYILWIMGSSTLEKVGQAPFLRFYFISGALIGLLTLVLMPVIGQYMTLAGAAPAILAVLVVWTMLHPDNNLLLFFLIPIKAKQLLPSILVLLLLINLSQLHIIEMVFNLMGLIVGYAYGAIVWGLETPYEFTHPIDKLLVSFGHWTRHLFSRDPAGRPLPDKSAEIIDFHTGKSVQDDDLFMDQILDKISKHGEKSLTWSERHRMKKISERKSRHNKP